MAMRACRASFLPLLKFFNPLPQPLRISSCGHGHGYGYRFITSYRFWPRNYEMGSKLNFCANISFLFTEHENVVDRYEVAKKFGFRGVEMLFPYSMELDELVKAKEKAGIEQILICSYPGDLGKGEFGLAAIPGRENDFITAMNLSVQYAKELNCKRIHIMSGILGKNTCKEKGLMTLENNLRKIIPLLEKNNIVGLIEPINKNTIPGYFLNDFDTAISIVKSIQSPTIRLQLDIFHLQFIHGDLTRRVKEALPITGHIQVAQAPHRHELDSPGEIDYHYMLELLRDEGYKGWIGLEYAPSGGNTIDSLAWIQNWGCKL